MATRDKPAPKSAQPQHPTMTKKVNTRLAKGGVATATNLTVEFDDMSVTLEFAMRSAVIAAQAIYRDAGSIPASDRMTITELKKRSGERGGFAKPTPDSVAARMAKLTDDEYRTFVTTKLGVTDRKMVEKLVASRNAANK